MMGRNSLDGLTGFMMALAFFVGLLVGLLAGHMTWHETDASPDTFTTFITTTTAPTSGCYPPGTPAEMMPRAPAVPILHGPRVAIDLSSANNFAVKLTGPLMLDDAQNVQAGNFGAIFFKQDRVGGHQVSYAKSWIFERGNQPQPGLDPGAVSVLFFYFYGPNNPGFFVAGMDKLSPRDAACLGIDWGTE